jgi:hypothetical protein
MKELGEIRVTAFRGIGEIRIAGPDFERRPGLLQKVFNFGQGVTYLLDSCCEERP